MKIVFMGTPDFAVPTLEALVNSDHQVVGVVTQPDKPKGRGGAVQFSPIKESALANNIPVYQPVKVKEPAFIKVLEELAPDVIVVVAFGQILSKSILNLPKYGCLNVHASLLPKLRGSSPIQWAIINGEKETGVTAMYMDVGIDTGDMLKKVVIPIEEKETGGSLHDKLAVLGGPLILSVLEELENNTAVREKQEDSLSSHVKMLDKELGNIKWDMEAVEIERLIRGLNPWPSTYTFLDGKMLKIWEADVIEVDYEAPCGTIVEINKDEIIVKTGKGALVIKELQLQGKKRMTADAFLRGNSLETGKMLL